MSHPPPELSRKKRKPRFHSFKKKCKPEETRILAYFKQFEKTYPFQTLFYRKPTCDIYVLQSLQGQLLGFYSLIDFLNPERELIRLKAGGISFHVLGPIKETDSLQL